MTHYVGVIDRSGMTWGVRFPDVAGCVGAGSSPKKAKADAARALRAALTHRRRSGFECPKARTLAEIRASGEVAMGETPVLIRASKGTSRRPSKRPGSFKRRAQKIEARR